MNLSRIHRLLKLVNLLQGGRAYNASALADACGVSRRTTFRDLDTLRQAGVPLAYDEHHQRYHIPSTYFLSPTNLSVEEALSVMVLCHELGGGDRLPFYAPARRAAVKLENSLPLRLRRQLRQVAGSVHIKLNTTSRPDGSGDVYQQLVDAIAANRCVRIRYASLTERDTIGTKLSPYQLLFNRHAWYVIGRSSLHRSTRTFHVGRIVELEPLPDRFQVPKGFSIDRYLRNAWNMIPEPGRDQKVVIRFSPMVATNVAEVTWHKTQRVVFNDDGSIDFHVTVSGLNEISWWILGYGDQAEVLQPARLQEIVAARAKGVVEKYR